MKQPEGLLSGDLVAESKLYPSLAEQTAFLKGAAYAYYQSHPKRKSWEESNMSLNEAIEHCDAVLPILENDAAIIEHKKLKNWLIELRNYRRKYGEL